jgi:predicted CopG family antitoxin
VEHEHIPVSRPVYVVLEAARDEDESFDDVLRRLLGVGGEKSPAGKSYLDDSSRWTVYDSLVSRMEGDEELGDTFDRLEERVREELSDADAEPVPDVDADEMRVDRTEMWTVYDQLVKERREGESLEETLARLEGGDEQAPAPD